MCSRQTLIQKNYGLTILLMNKIVLAISKRKVRIIEKLRVYIVQIITHKKNYITLKYKKKS